nr:hypothetical protein [Tanacetum cinerariifolium]
VAIINRCLSRKTTSLDKLRLSRAQILWGFFYKKNVDFVELIWEDFMYQIDYIETSAKRRENIPYPRFTKAIIQHFISKDKSISKRNKLFIHSIKNESVLGVLKFVSMGKDNQVYRISIPDVMINQEIENSKSYKTYLTYSTGVTTPKKARKWKQPKTTKSLTADDNIISEDLDAALELAKSISITKAEEQEAARLMHETHERLVTEKPTKRRWKTGVIFKDTPTVPQKKPLNQSQKLKGLRVSDLEKEVKELKQADLTLTIHASIIFEVPSAVNEYPGSKKHQKSQYIIKSSDKTALAEFDQKQAMFDSMHESKSFNKHPANKTLYHTLMESLISDEKVMDQGVAVLIKQKKIPHDDEDRDQDPHAGPDQGQNRLEMTWVTQMNNLMLRLLQSKIGSRNLQGLLLLIRNETQENWLMINQNKVGLIIWRMQKKPPIMFDDFISTPIDFSAIAMNRLQINKLTKADLVRPVYNILKGMCKSCMELEYNKEECYRALSDQLDWNNPEGNQCPYDLSKPLPLHESQGHLTVPADFFLNNDLEYLRGGNIDRKYTTSTTKTKATKYDVEGIGDMVPKL